MRSTVPVSCVHATALGCSPWCATVFVRAVQITITHFQFSRASVFIETSLTGTPSPQKDFRMLQAVVVRLCSLSWAAFVLFNTKERTSCITRCVPVSIVSEPSSVDSAASRGCFTEFSLRKTKNKHKEAFFFFISISRCNSAFRVYVG